MQIREKEFHILYILVIPRKRVFKIGITEKDRLENRFKEIERDFGSIDKSKSMFFGSKSSKTIKNIEKGLHSLFWEHSKSFSKGSGKTEFFDLKTYKVVVKLLTQKKRILNLNGPYYLGKSSFNFKSLFMLILSISLVSGYFFFTDYYILTFNYLKDYIKSAGWLSL